MYTPQARFVLLVREKKCPKRASFFTMLLLKTAPLILKNVLREILMYTPQARFVLLVSENNYYGNGVC